MGHDYQYGIESIQESHKAKEVPNVAPDALPFDSIRSCKNIDFRVPSYIRGNGIFADELNCYCVC